MPPDAPALPEGYRTPKSVPTFTFVGVTTGQSSIMRVFPRWMEVLGRPEVVLEGVDFALHDEPRRYRALVRAIREDPLALGGLVTSHKIDLLQASRDLFDELSPHAALLGEVSSIASRGGRLAGHTTDPEAGGRSLAAVLGPGYFGRTGGDVLFFGAGGAATALAVYLAERPDPADRPRRLWLTDIDPDRLERISGLLDALPVRIPATCVPGGDPVVHDALMRELPAGSVVVNATGMGKDRPGSPITDEGVFPREAVVWELNYRGERRFLRQARARQDRRGLRVEDGWTYFMNGWTSVIRHVLEVEIDPATFDRLAAIATALR